MGDFGNGYQQKDKTKAKSDKTEHEMESVEKSKVNPITVKVKDRAEVGNQEIVRSQNGNVVNENVQENVRNVLVNSNLIHTLSREVDVSMSWNDFKFMMIEEFCPSHEMQKLETEISGALTDEAVRNGSIKKVEKRGNVGEPRKDKNGRDDKRGLALKMLLLQLQTL
nr:hypothetical protein [Tanacetum cinerariifolium]